MWDMNPDDERDPFGLGRSLGLPGLGGVPEGSNAFIEDAKRRASLQQQPPAATPIGPDSLPDAPGVPVGTQGSDYANTGARNQEQIRGAYLEGFPAQNIAPPEIASYTNQLMYGPEGDKLVRETTVEGPKRYAAAARALAGAEASQGNAEEEALKRSGMAQAIASQTFQRNQGLRQKEMSTKLAQYDEAAKNYSNDLADTGKFWRNPANVMSSFVVALSSLGSAQNHQMMMQNLNNAIVQDFQQRRAAADTRLGAMQSNIAHYRNLFADKDAGDMFALSEAQRIGAQELREIAAHFKGPQAQAKAEMAIEGLTQQSNLLRMNALAKAYQSPHLASRLETEYMRKLQAGYPGSVVSYGDKNAPQTLPPNIPGTDIPAELPENPYKPMATPPAPTGDGQAVPYDWGSGAKRKVGGQVPPGMVPYDWGTPKPAPIGGLDSPQPDPNMAKAVSALGGKPTEKTTGGWQSDKGIIGKFGAQWNERVPGTAERVWNHRRELQAEGISKFPGNPQAARNYVNERISDEIKSAAPVAQMIAEKGIAADANGWSAFEGELNRTEAIAKTMHKGGPDELLSFMRSTGFATGLQDKITQLEVRLKSNPSNQYEARELENLKGAQRLQQMLASGVAGYYHQMIGGNQSIHEKELMELIISPTSNWNKIRGFSHDQTRRSNAVFAQAIGAMPLGAQAHYLQMFGSPQSMSWLGADTPGYKE